MSALKPSCSSASKGDMTIPKHTDGHIDCPACEYSRRLALAPEQFGQLPFSQAAQVWLMARQSKLGARTVANNITYVTWLGRFFGEMRLCDIHVGNGPSASASAITGES